MRSPIEPAMKQVVKRIVDDGLHLRVHDDYEWCVFCDGGVFTGAGVELAVTHGPDCVLAEVADNLGIPLPEGVL